VSRDFVDESSIMYWLGPVSREDCGCPMSGPHGIDCRNHPDRIAEDELRFDVRHDRKPHAARIRAAKEKESVNG